MKRAEYLARWSALHGDADVAQPLVRGWLSVMFTVASPLARLRVSPTAVTAFGVAVAVGAVALTASGGKWILLAAIAVVLASVVDGLDGAVAVMQRKESPFGYVIDSVADRCCDLLFFACLAVAGAPLPLVAALSVSTMLQETARARATAAGLTDIAVITVWERPSRVITTVVTLGAVVLVPAQAQISTVVGSVVGAALAVVGLTQFLVVAHRDLMRRDHRRASSTAAG
ncbi:CDP-alcohol phosphatidyltransferase family protein [Actinomycetes bacterium M1A6_2h]